MLTVFVLAFAILAVSVSFNGLEPQNNTKREMTVVEIVEKGMVSSVSIMAAMSDSTASGGSGFVVSDYGYIVTNYHVVEGAQQIVIIDSTGKQYSADIVDYNKHLDLALLYAENANIKAVTLADSDSLKLGETVVAIGSPTGSGSSLSVSNGIVSGVNRQTSSVSVGMIQTNAPLNPGNSGGPLFDSKGNVVGIVTSKLVYTDDSNGEKIPLDGIAYAIPINAVKEYVEDWMSKDLRKPMLGISAVPVTAGKMYFYDGAEGVLYNYLELGNVKYKVDSRGSKYILSVEDIENEINEIIDAKATGIYVVGVTKGLGAYGKLQRDDIVTGLGGEIITSVYDARNVFQNFNAGDAIKVDFYRNGEMMSANMILKTKGDMLAAERNS